MYRARLMSTHSGMHLVHLQGSYALIHQRLEARQSHFMRADLLTSQFETLEEPEESEGVLTVDISQQPEVIVSVIKHQLAL